MSELSLRENGVERARYTNDINDAVVELAQAWEEFRLLPLEEKQLLATSNLFNGVGYESKINDSISKDRKENFDFSLYKDVNQSRIHELNVSTEAIELEGAFQNLAYAVQPMLENFWWKLRSKTHGQIYDHENHPAGKSASDVFLRCLHYPSGAEPGSIIAEPHTDHSGGTTHFYETTDGCEMLALDTKEWEPLPINEAEGVRFAGMQAQLSSGNEIKALCHRVVANEITAEFGRSAIVGFMPMVGVPQYDRKRRGRTQDQVPGFNYELNSDELRDYFIA